MARVVVAGYPHHVTQRGNRRQQTFFNDGDFAEYKRLLSVWSGRCGVVIWAYCLMPHHVHLIAVPQSAEALRVAIGETHRRYTRRINFREGWRGHLWQGRFASVVLDGAHLVAAARYVERNPVRARLCAQPWDYAARLPIWMARTMVSATTAPLLELMPDWRAFVEVDSSETELRTIRRHERTGRPLGSPGFVKSLEGLLRRPLFPQKPGPKPQESAHHEPRLFES
jgi:putative transposase